MARFAVIENAPKTRHRDLQPIEGRVTGLLSEELINQHIARHNFARMQREQREQGALPLSAQAQDVIPSSSLQRSQEPKVEKRAGFATFHSPIICC
jgi:hypothetical protein